MERAFACLFIALFPFASTFIPPKRRSRTSLPFGMDQREPYASISTMKTVNLTETKVDDEPLSESVQSLYDAVSFWQQVDDSTRIIYDEDDDNTEISVINSIVFEFNETFVLAILKSEDRVDEKLLTDIVSSSLGVDKPVLELASSDRLLDLCGFEAGTVPPIGIQPALAVLDDKVVPENLVKAGGGLPDQSLILSVDTLFQAQPNIQVGSIAQIEAPSTVETVFSYEQPRPFFVVEPPDAESVEKILNGEEGYSLSPVRVTCVGTIASVRRIARQLAFCDFAPVEAPTWRSATTGEAMSVQLIAGQTICKTVGEAALRKLKEKDLILIHGHTNMESRDSLQNWKDKRVLDIVLHRYEILREDSQTSNEIKVEKNLERLQQMAAVPVDPQECLKMYDIYNSTTEAINGESVDSSTVLVEDMVSVKEFSRDLAKVLKTPTLSESAAQLAGIDCEWQPNFLLRHFRDPQPVLLLQICLHPLMKTYLFDLQTLLRPMMPESQPMDKLEKEVSLCLGALFESKKLVKVGFSVLQDLRQLAASYPHIPAFQFYNAVLESSILGKKAMRMAKMSHSREATSSLSRLVQQFTGKPLDKRQQCSDWANRPLSREQMEYAALDAAVTPSIVETMLRAMEAKFYSDGPQLGRWKNDRSFQHMLSSSRFVFVDTADGGMLRKLKAKRIVGDVLVVTQTWTTGDVPPKLPAVSEGEGGRYRDTKGILKVPSECLSLRTKYFNGILTSCLGQRSFKSKQQCVQPFLHGPASIPEGSQLDFPQRSGFVEFADAIFLFVNMITTKSAEGRPRSYPNQWFNNGRVLTWFLRETEWDKGRSVLSKKLLGKGGSVVTLFVKVDGLYLFCGRCKVHVNEEEEESLGTLRKLYLILLDWNELDASSDDFKRLLASGANSGSKVEFDLD